jgi:hypothetical protein
MRASQLAYERLLLSVSACAPTDHFDRAPLMAGKLDVTVPAVDGSCNPAASMP